MLLPLPMFVVMMAFREKLAFSSARFIDQHLNFLVALIAVSATSLLRDLVARKRAESETIQGFVGRFSTTRRAYWPKRKIHFKC